MSFTIHYSTPGACFAQKSNLFVHIWASEVRAEDLRVFRELRLAQDPKHPGGVTGLVILCDGLKIPSTAAREEGLLLAQAIDKTTRCMGIVTESSGLLSSIMRTLVSTVALAARSTYPNKFFGNLDDAWKWVFPYIDGPAESAAMLSGITKLREDFVAGLVPSKQRHAL